MTLTPDDYAMMCAYLAHTYEAALFTHEDRAHPVVWHAAPDNQRDDLDSAIAYVSPDTPDQDALAFYNYAYLHTLQNSQRHLFNGDTVNLRLLRVGKRLTLDVGAGRYFDMLATCGALEAEMVDVLDQGVARFPMRSLYHRDYPAHEMARSGKGRSAAIGCATLFVVNDGGEYKALLSQRTAAHATNPNALHLLPAFMLEADLLRPARDGDRGSYPLTDHFYREFLEEFFGREESSQANPDDHPALQTLKAMQAARTASLHYLGIAVNLMTLRAEICALLLVDDPQWWRSVQADLSMPETQTLLPLPIADDATLLAALPDDYFMNTVPQTTAALWEGVALARTL